MHFELTYKDLFRAIYSWSQKNSAITAVTLSGIGKSSFSPSSISPKYQFKVYTSRVEFLEGSDWIRDLGEYLICFYDVHFVPPVEIESRVVVFHPGVIVEFLFEAQQDLAVKQQHHLITMLRNYN